MTSSPAGVNLQRIHLLFLHIQTQPHRTSSFPVNLTLVQSWFRDPSVLHISHLGQTAVLESHCWSLLALLGSALHVPRARPDFPTLLGPSARHCSLAFGKHPPPSPASSAARLPRVVPCELVERGAHSLMLAVLSRLCLAPVSEEKTILKRKQAAVTLGMVS